MATKNPRISVMLRPESDVILSRLSAVSKQSKSSIIAEFLEETCMPMFERMVVVLEAAANATDEAKAATKQGFADAEEKLLGVIGMTTDLFDQASRPVMDEAAAKRTDGGTRKRHSARPDSAAPPPCNTGVRYPKYIKMHMHDHGQRAHGRSSMPCSFPR